MVVRKYGTAGNDVINGNSDDSNIVYGYAGNDTVTGSSYADYLYGQTGDDRLIGLGGNDQLDGYDGNDYLDGGTGNDILKGENGNDTYNFGNNFGTDQIVDSDGNNYLRFADITSGNYVNVNLETRSFESNTGGFKVNSFLNYVTGITGSQGGDNLIGNSANNYLAGYLGNDSIDGGAGNDDICGNQGNDAIYGGSGNDRINGGDGNDILDGGDGNDEYHFNDNFGVDTVSDTGGVDMLNFGSITSSSNHIYINLSDHVFTSMAGEFSNTVFFHDIEKVKGTLGDDIITGNALDNCLIGKEGFDVIDGGIGNDKLDGSEGNDILYGGKGIDLLFGGDGNDTLVGGTECDDIRGDAGDDTYIFNLGDFRDTIRDSAGINDKILLGDNIFEKDIAIFQSNNDLWVAYSNNDRFIIKDQFSPSNAIEKIQLDSGMFLVDSDFSSIITEMNDYISEHELFVPDIRYVQNNPDLMDIIESHWHAA